MLNFSRTMTRNFTRYLFILVVLFLLLSRLVLWLYQCYLQERVKKEIQLKGEEVVDELTKVRLGGVEQWIRVRGNHRNNPILLFVHGGLGAPLFPAIKKIHRATHIESLFTVVYWEQRGTGKSFQYAIPLHSMTLPQFISDASELSRYLLTKYHVPRIYLLGRSFGSLVGILTVQKNPELYYGYIGVGQMVTPLMNDSLSYEKTLKLARVQENTRALEELIPLGYPPYDYRQVLLQRRWLTRLSANDDSIYSWNQNNEYFFHLKDLLSTPEYSLLDIIKMGTDPYFSIRHLWNRDLYQIDLIPQVKDLDVPVIFLCGRNDNFTPSVLVEKFYEQLEAPAGKWLVWFESSGHFPEYDEPRHFREALRNYVFLTYPESIN